MNAAGRVCTGFSDPFVAKYNYAGGAVSFTNGMRLARGVKVNVSPTVSDDNNFYADNEVAESDSGMFTGGTATLTVDGLHMAAERFIYGLPEPEEVAYGESQKANFTKFGRKAEPPYVAVAVVVRYRSGGADIYVPTIFVKTKFKTHGLDAQTQDGEETNWQTQDLETVLHRDDTPDHNWKWVGDDFTTREEAASLIKGMFAVSEAAETSNQEAG